MTASFKLPVMRVSIGLIMLFQVSSLLVREFVRAAMIDHGVDAASAKHLSALAGFAMLGVLMWPVLAERMSEVRALFQRPGSWVRLVASSVAVGLALRAMSWALAIALVQLGFKGPADPAGAAGPLFWWQCPPATYLALSLVVMALLTPLVEETINRGLFLCSLLPRRRVAAVVLSAALFAVLHTVHDMAVAAIFGVVVAIQMLHYRTLWGPMIAHGTFNGMTAVDWDCLKGIWIPAENSLSMGVLAMSVAVFCLLAATKLAMHPRAGAH